VNLWSEVRGSSRPDEIVLVGSHYDSLRHCPAANDNGSGVAATPALMRRFAGGPRPERTIRFAFFANEEPPHFWTEFMGSYVMGEACRAKNENIVAMLTPETIGCYSDEPGSQRYPLPFVKRLYGDKGNFIAFIGVGKSAGLVRKCVGLFREHAQFPSMGAALPSIVPGVGASDHWGFWRVGYPALMVTDTAPFRYRYYHTRLDTPDKMDFDRMARVVDGLRGVVADLASGR
jgi:Zn-dependent M28 family amino/carboxypeptidase